MTYTRALVVALTVGCISAAAAAQSLVLETVLRPKVPYDTAEFGFDLDIDGNHLAATTAAGPLGPNQVHVYAQTGEGWQESAILIPNVTLGKEDGLIGRIDLSEDALIVGTAGADLFGQDAGAAIIYRSVSGAWITEAVLSAPFPRAGDLFGAAVAIDEDHAVVGDSAGASQGRAWVFRRINGAWTPVDELRPPASSLGAFNFPFAVDVSPPNILVGAPFKNCEAFLYRRTESGYALDDVLVGDGFGYCNFDTSFGAEVRVHGNRAAVTNNDIEDLPHKVHVYERAGGTWMETAQLSPNAYGGFVNDVDLTDDRILIGSGPCVFLLARTGNSWQLVDQGCVPPRLIQGSFSSKVALTNRWAIVNTAPFVPFGGFVGGHVVVFRIVGS